MGSRILSDATPLSRYWLFCPEMFPSRFSWKLSRSHLNRQSRPRYDASKDQVCLTPEPCCWDVRTSGLKCFCDVTYASSQIRSSCRGPLMVESFRGFFHKVCEVEEKVVAWPQEFSKAKWIFFDPNSPVQIFYIWPRPGLNCPRGPQEVYARSSFFIKLDFLPPKS